MSLTPSFSDFRSRGRGGGYFWATRRVVSVLVGMNEWMNDE